MGKRWRQMAFSWQIRLLLFWDPSIGLLYEQDNHDQQPDYAWQYIISIFINHSKFSLEKSRTQGSQVTVFVITFHALFRFLS